jgi:hypothetical protein
MDTINDLGQNTQVLEVTENAKKYLKTTSSWTTFMAILSFIGIGFMVLCGIIVLAAGSFLNGANYDAVPFSGFYSFFGLFYIVLAAIMFFPALFLLRFSQKTTKALASQDTLVMEDAFKNMKAYWKFTGILAIIMIALCIIMVPIMIAVTAAAMPTMY